ncbi:MAG: VOC family protein [Planctomycetes bacterium]|nr:VOC family protein [Planctomycetota bacterium]MCW8142085.1 VOC family protein [Planctomycetota bacterium]
MDRPPLAGLWHVALNVTDLERALAFYEGDLGMTVEWRPDPDNVYLTSGRDNLALHRVPAIADEAARGRLDHVGFVLPAPELVDAWAAWLEARGHALAQAPKTHRDGARSFYVRDPQGNLVQFIHHPPLAGLARQVVP